MKRRLNKRVVYTVIAGIFIYLTYAITTDDKRVRKEVEKVAVDEPIEPDFIDTVDNDEEKPSNNQVKTESKQIQKAKVPNDAKNNEERILNKMKESMLKNDNFDKLQNVPKPKEILTDARGPVRYKTDKRDVKKEHTLKLLILSRKKSGFAVINQFLNEDKFFMHGEVSQDKNIIANIFNCVLDPQMIKHFTLEIAGKFGETPYFKEKCLLESGAICTDALSYEKTCNKYDAQLMRSQEFSLEFVKTLLEDNEDIRAIFLVRDPRSTVKKKNPVDIKPICETLQSDIKLAIQMQSEMPGQFSMAKYEDLAREPRNETLKLFQSLNLANILNLNAAPEPTLQEESAPENVWNKDKNPISLVNKWKQKLNMKQIKLIETQCLEALTTLEYHLLGIPLVDT